MKAAVLYANDDLRYDDYDTPEVTPGTVKIKVKASGICGSDVPRVLHNGAHYYPIVLGHEFSGEVVETGEGVMGVAVGDTVTGAPRIPCLTCRDCQSGNISQCKNDSFIGSRSQGSFAEYIVIPERNAVKYDPGVSFEDATFFEPSTIALRGVNNSSYKGGEYVAVVGGGTIGVFTMQWAKIFGARRIVVFDVDEERLALAKESGADYAINSGIDGFLEQAMELTDGQGFETVFEAAGNNTTLVMALKLAAARAHVSLIGTPHDSVTFSKAEWELINRKEMLINGCWQGYSAPFPGREWELTAHYFATGQLRVLPGFVFKKFPLSEAKQAFDLYKDPSQVHGKILLVN